MNIILIGIGSIAQQHIKAISNITDAKIVSLVSLDLEEAREYATAHNIGHFTNSLDEALLLPNTDCAIICSPSPVHAQQAIQVMAAGKHVLIEIPMAISLQESRQICQKQVETGLVAMVAHTRRFNPPHQWLHQKFKKGELNLHHLVIETYFHRRENTNSLGQKRDWVDNLLWHHACHGVDLFSWQTTEPLIKRWAQQGPISQAIGVPLDMTIGLKSTSNKLCSMALSFNNDGPIGSWYRYICEEGTFKVRYDELFDGCDKPIEFEWDKPKNGIELQDREFFEAIKTGRKPESDVHSCFLTMENLHKLEYVAKN